VPEGGKLVTVKDVAMEHWAAFGRNFFSRYDYEGVDSDAAKAVMDGLKVRRLAPVLAPHTLLSRTRALPVPASDTIGSSAGVSKGQRQGHQDGRV